MDRDKRGCDGQGREGAEERGGGRTHKRKSFRTMSELILDLQVCVFSGGVAHVCPASRNATWWVLRGQRRVEQPEMVVTCDLHNHH